MSAPEAKRPQSSYVAITSALMLDNFGLKLSREEREAQIRKPDSFYRVMMRLPVASILADINFVQLLDIHETLQDKLMAVIFASYGKNASEGGGLEGLSATLQERIQALQVDFESEDEKVNQLKESHAELKANISAAVREKIDEWHANNQGRAKQITQALRDAGIDVNDDFNNTLYRKLILASSKSTLDKTEMRNAGLRSANGMAAKATLAALAQHDIAIDKLPDSVLAELDTQMTQEIQLASEYVQTNARACFDSATEYANVKRQSAVRTGNLDTLRLPPQISKAVMEKHSDEMLEIDPEEKKRTWTAPGMGH